MTALDLVTDALREIGVVNAVDAASAEDAEFGLTRLNAILDRFNAQRLAVYADQVLTFTLVPATQPHTIGASGGTWTTTQRPESIVAANLIISDVRTPITLRDAEWWLSLSDPTLSGSQPSDLYYEKAWPLGNCRFWPVPDSAYDVELLTRVVLSALALGDTFTLPPGYQDAISKTLAEDLCAPFQVELPPLLPSQAREARARVFSANVQAPRIQTADYGVPGRRAAGFDYRTGR